MNNTHIINFFNCWYTQYVLFLVFPQRQINLKCLHGSWDRIVTCQPTDCGFPDQSYVYHAVFSCPWGTTFGKQCSFTCRPPAKLQGQLCRCWNVLILIAETSNEGTPQPKINLLLQADATQRTRTWAISYIWRAFTWIYTECASVYCANSNQVQVWLCCRSSDSVASQRFTQRLSFYGRRAVNIQTAARCCCYHQPVKQNGFLRNYHLK